MRSVLNCLSFSLSFFADWQPLASSAASESIKKMLKRQRPVIIVIRTRPKHVTNVKTLMGKQLNKAIKKSRRLRYIKRKKIAAKTKKVAKFKPGKELKS